MNSSQNSECGSVSSGSTQDKAANRARRPKPKTNEDMVDLLRQIAGDILVEWDRQLAEVDRKIQGEYNAVEELKEECPIEDESDVDEVVSSQNEILSSGGTSQPMNGETQLDVLSGEHILKNERTLNIPSYAVLANVDIDSLEKSIFNEASFSDEKDESFVESVWSEMAQEFTVPNFSIDYNVCGSDHYVGQDDSYMDDSFSSDTLTGYLVMGAKFNYDAPDPASPINSTPPYFPSQDENHQAFHSLSNTTSSTQKNSLTPLVSAESSAALRLQSFLSSGETFLPY